jgi:hypothetical protein
VPGTMKYGTCYRAVAILAARSLFVLSPSVSQQHQSYRPPRGRSRILCSLMPCWRKLRLIRLASRAGTHGGNCHPQVVEASGWLEVPAYKSLDISGFVVRSYIRRLHWS